MSAIGAHNFEVFCHCLLQGVDRVIRAKNLTRKIYVEGKSEDVARGRYLSMGSQGQRAPSGAEHDGAVRFGMIGMSTPGRRSDRQRILRTPPAGQRIHKAFKTGCQIEERLYETAPRWENVTALLSVTAVRLLQLKTIAVKEPTRPATTRVPPCGSAC